MDTDAFDRLLGQITVLEATIGNYLSEAPREIQLNVRQDLLAIAVRDKVGGGQYSESVTGTENCFLAAADLHQM